MLPFWMFFSTCEDTTVRPFPSRIDTATDGLTASSFSSRFTTSLAGFGVMLTLEAAKFLAQLF